MMLNGLPDFSRELVFSRGRGYHCYHYNGVVVLPHTVEIPFDNSGLPKFGLQLLRPSTPFFGHKGQAILSVLLQPAFDLKAARDYFEERQNVVPIQPCVVNHGDVCFSLPESFSNIDIVDELAAYKPLNLHGGVAQQLIMHLSAFAGAFWKQLITEGVLLIDSSLNYRIRGVSPRFNCKVKFNPQELPGSLHTIAEQRNVKTDGVLSLASLLSIVDDNLDTLPISLLNIDSPSTPFIISEILDQTRRQLFLEALLDHIIDRFSANTCVNQSNELCSKLALVDEFGAGTFEWNMSKPLLSERLWSITASPFNAMNGRLSGAQLSELIEEKELPFIASNKSQIFVYANFADNAKSVLSLGANFRQKAILPDRPVALNRTLEFIGDDLSAKIFLHNNRDNTISYSVEGVAVLETDKGIINCLGTVTPSAELLLVLGPHDFSIIPIAFALDPSWQGFFNADIQLRFEHDHRLHKVEEKLDANRPSVQFFVPKSAINIEGKVLLQDRSSGKTLEADFSGMSGMAINQFAYAQCGMQTAQIVAEFSNDQTWHAVELRPVNRASESAADLSLVHLTPSNPETFWRWFSHSPFDAAYQYRVLDSLGRPTHDWLTVEYPYPLLRLGVLTNQSIEPTVVTGSL
ncbi:MAG: hypothetical protein JKX81_08310 [Arenicella sp.]|nr:hypothetical protein [Arenicella sp.]